MEKQITILMIAILIISLASGFILSFIVYQPQIQALKNDVTTLQEEINSQLAENEETLSDLNETIAELNAKIENLTATSGTTSGGNTELPPEILEIENVQATTNGTHFDVKFNTTNSGTTSATIIMISLNQYPLPAYPEVTALVFDGTPIAAGADFNFPIPVGTSPQFTITLKQGVVDSLNLQSGDSIRFTLTSAKLYQYTTTLDLP